jgi:hypothetical protein
MASTWPFRQRVRSQPDIEDIPQADKLRAMTGDRIPPSFAARIADPS